MREGHEKRIEPNRERDHHAGKPFTLEIDKHGMRMTAPQWSSPLAVLVIVVVTVVLLFMLRSAPWAVLALLR